MLASAVIAAGGSGTRMGEFSPKQFLDLNGKPMIAWSLEAFSQAAEVGEIVVVCPLDYIDETKDYVKKYCRGKSTKVVTGGATRQESVKNGLMASSEDLVWIAVHDAARPFIQSDEIDAVCLMARELGAAIIGTKIVDTIKEVQNEIIVRTLERSRLIAAQTPQVCRKIDLLSAYEFAEKTGFKATDEASLLENSGITVAVHLSSPMNFKITTSADLDIARAISVHMDLDKNDA